MPQEKSNRVKTYVVIGLALVFVVVGYFRFIHGKIASDGDQPSFTASRAQLEVPRVELKTWQNRPQRKGTVNEIFRTVRRDIFTPLKSPVEVEAQPQLTMQEPSRPAPSRPAPSLKLMGTIVGGGKPIAIINDQFVRMGDMIGEYKVIKIEEKEVLLYSDHGKIVLEMVK